MPPFERFHAITVALPYLVNLNKGGGYLYLSNLINWKNFDDFSMRAVPFLGGKHRNGMLQTSNWHQENQVIYLRKHIDYCLLIPTSVHAAATALQPTRFARKSSDGKQIKRSATDHRNDKTTLRRATLPSLERDFNKGKKTPTGCL